jgi:hypothetical protein
MAAARRRLLSPRVKVTSRSPSASTNLQRNCPRLRIAKGAGYRCVQTLSERSSPRRLDWTVEPRTRKLHVRRGQFAAANAGGKSAHRMMGCTARAAGKFCGASLGTASEPVGWGYPMVKGPYLAPPAKRLAGSVLQRNSVNEECPHGRSASLWPISHTGQDGDLARTG